MTVSSVSVLLAEFGSGDEVLTWTVLITVPLRLAVTLIVTVTVPPLGISPSEHVTVPSASLHAPAVELTETKRTFSGRVSVSPTERAEPGPEFVTARVYENALPRTTGSAESDLSMARSAAGRSSWTKISVAELVSFGT